jgi:vancomycin resistance protein VanW
MDTTPRFEVVRTLTRLRARARRTWACVTLLWRAGGWARRRPAGEARWAPVLVHRAPLARARGPRQALAAAGSLHNLRLAADALDGVVMRPGETLSFWLLVGEPTEARGFCRGLEPEDAAPTPYAGGGLGVLARALLEVAARAGLTVVERPEGRGAVVAYPLPDVRVRNDQDGSFALAVRCWNGVLEVELRASGAAAARAAA